MGNVASFVLCTLLIAKFVRHICCICILVLIITFSFFIYYSFFIAFFIDVTLFMPSKCILEIICSVIYRNIYRTCILSIVESCKSLLITLDDCQIPSSVFKITQKPKITQKITHITELCQQVFIYNEEAHCTSHTTCAQVFELGLCVVWMYM